MMCRALVTGGSGVIGRSVVEHLLRNGWYVRVLSRNSDMVIEGAEVVAGDITDSASLGPVVSGVDAVFHCAGETHHETKMMAVNVNGTANIVAAARKYGIKYFCHMSSVSVYGTCRTGRIDEDNNTEPVTVYARSKLESEKQVFSTVPCDNTCILRIGNVVSHRDFGVLGAVINGGLRSFMHISLLGARNAHMVHADDVASAAIFFFDRPLNNPRILNVSYDDEESSTLMDAYAAWQHLCHKRKEYTSLPQKILNTISGLVLRTRIVNRFFSLRVRFSSNRLLRCGFEFPLGFNGAIKDIYGRLQG
jgi:nucleoside-diphosphate-sugar epimerase